MNLIQFYTGCTLHALFEYAGGYDNDRLTQYGGQQKDSEFPVQRQNTGTRLPKQVLKRAVRGKTLNVSLPRKIKNN